MIALVKRSKVIQGIHCGMVCPGGVLWRQVHLQLMWFVNWIHCVGVLFLSDFAMMNSVTETSSLTEMSSVTELSSVTETSSVKETNSVTEMNSAIVKSSVTGSLPMTEIDFVTCCYLVQKNMSI